MQFQNYTILSKLGEGGMAAVYLAEHKQLQKQVAIKVLFKKYTDDEHIRKRFLAEARNLFTMSHPNIIKVTDLIDEGDTVAFVMEHIDGETLKEYLERKGKLTDDEIRNIFTQMLEAVGYVHEQGLIHRDIKPSNFMIDKKGKVKLLDFGIAKNTDSSSAEYTQTGTGMQMGTPMYMSPEQVKNTKEVTFQSDIYSLGVVLWQMVMGKKPYNGDTLSTFEIQLKIFQEHLPLTHTNWDISIQKATEKDVNNRFKNAEEFKLVLNSLYSKVKDSDATVIIQKEEKTIIQNQNLSPIYTDDYGIEFILVEAGTFMMGVSDVEYEEYLEDRLQLLDPSDFDSEEDDDEDWGLKASKPAHKVTLTESYYIGKYPVTQAQWERVMGNNPSEYKERPNCPVESVSWDDCQKFISKLNQKTGKKYRLPTEAEWEFAARGGNKSRAYKFSGSNNIDEVAWFNDDSHEIKKVEKKYLWGFAKTYEDEWVYNGTKPVGTKKPNELGIYDMSGNVSEWCIDKMREYCSEYQTNPLGTNDSDDFHVMRGGNWFWSSDDCLVSYRSHDNRAFGLIGFRLVLVP